MSTKPLSATDIALPDGASMTLRLYGRLRQDILTTVLAPQRKLKVEDLRRAYGAGATPIREALSQLAAEGLIDRIDNCGFRVAEVSRAEFDDLVRVRCMLESSALRLAIEHGDQRWEDAVGLAFLHLQRLSGPSGQPAFHNNDDWEQRHRAFHEVLLGACGSSILLDYCAQLYDRNIRYRNLAGSAYPARDVLPEHEALMRAALNRDTETATALLAAHYARTGEFLARALGSLEPATPR